MPETIINLPPTKTTPEIKIKEMELEVLRKFLASDRQKTQITHDERILIAVLDGYAKNPYPISSDICTRLRINFNKAGFELSFLSKFLECFIEFGIPLDREGRKEEVKVLNSYFNAHNEEEKKEQNITSKLMK